MFASPVAPIIVVTVMLAVLGGYLYIGLLIARAPLKQSTVDRFATRQRLVLRDANAAYVVGALLITHRWRRTGLVVGLLIGAVTGIRDGSYTVHFVAGFLGWFAGAVIAEWRIGSLDEPGERRAANLAPRGLGRFLTPLVVGLIALTALLSAALVVTAAVRAGSPAEWAWWLGYLVLLGLALGLTARAIVNRPSGFADTDLRDADDARRCHGLTVLAGSGIAAAYPAIAGLALLTAYPAGVPFSMDPVWTFWIMLGCIAVGWWVAVKSPSAREGHVRIPVPVSQEAAQP